MSQVLDLALPANKRSNGQTEPNLQDNSISAGVQQVKRNIRLMIELQIVLFNQFNVKTRNYLQNFLPRSIFLIREVLLINNPTNLKQKKCNFNSRLIKMVLP